MAEPVAADRNVDDDVRSILDEEVIRLPERYRAVIVLCDLEGKTRAEAAVALGCPAGTVAGHLARARRMLGRRLSRRGLSAAALVVPFANEAAAVPPALLSSTIRAATLHETGHAAFTEPVVALSEGTVKTMLWTRLIRSAVLFAAVCTVAVGGSVVRSALALAPDGSNAPAATAQRKKADRPDAGTRLKGELASVDAEKNSVTLTTRTFDRKAREATETRKTFAVTREAKIHQDEAPVKLGDLKLGHPTFLTLAEGAVVAITVEGGTGQGEFLSANIDRNTIAIIAGRDMARRVVHLLKETKVLDADGKPIRIQDLKRGTRLLLTRSVEDDNTAVRVQVMREGSR
jgi:hypothetical protein